MSRKITVAVSGMNAGESPQPGPAVARSLRGIEGLNVRIVGLLYDSMESGVYMDGMLDDAFLVPYPSSGTDALADRLAYIHSKIPLHAIVPTLDAELPAYVRLQPRLEALGPRMFIPTSTQLDARSKERLGDLAQRLQIPFPRQRIVGDLDMVASTFQEFTGPVMVKGPFYEAGKAKDAAEAIRIAGKIVAKWGFPVILQECIEGEEYDLALLGDGEGKAVGAVAIKKMALTEKGKAFSGMTISDEEIFAIGRRFIAGTKWQGALELEFVKSSRDNKYYLIEINPRFPAWIYLASQVGQNLPLAAVRMALGEKVRPFPEYKPGTFFVRHAIDVVSDIRRLERLAVEGEFHA